MARRRRLAKRYRKNPDSPSPSGKAMAMEEVWGWIGPGFAAFAAARFITYLATTQLEKRKPAWGKHAGAIAAVGTFLGAWLVAHRVRFLARYVEPIVVGTGIAGVQSLAQLYLPKIGWMVGDPNAGVDATSAAVAAAQQVPELPPGFSVIDDPSAYDYNDAHDGGIFTAAQPPAAAQAPQMSEDDILSELDLDTGNQMGGIFAGN